jgi:hypothetical protein
LRRNANVRDSKSIEEFSLRRNDPIWGFNNGATRGNVLFETEV